MRLYLSIRRWGFPALAFLLAYFAIDIALWVMAQRLPIHPFPPEVATMVAQIHMGILCVCSGFYGFYRAASHPINHKGYLEWLRASPWHPRMKLPLGPATLVWWDVPVLLSAAALAHWHVHRPMFEPFLIFSCAYIFFSLAPLSSTFLRGGYVAFVGLAFVARWIQDIQLAATVAAVVICFTQYALWRSLRAYPWERKTPADPLTSQGWLSMIPPNAEPRVPTHRALAGCALLGVWLWAALCLAGAQLRPIDASVLLCSAATMGVLIRWAAYCGKYKAPLTLLGRLRTGHLIIPGYDLVMLAPATVLPVAMLLPLALGGIGASPPITVATTSATSLAILLVAPPSLRVWQLTGTHRTIGSSTGQRG